MVRFVGTATAVGFPWENGSDLRRGEISLAVHDLSASLVEFETESRCAVRDVVRYVVGRHVVPVANTAVTVTCTRASVCECG